MANQFSLQGAQPQKQIRFAPIYTGRWSSGLWTNRSPLRDANTSRLTEKFYGPAGDALIGGQNVEITDRLTLARRPGSLVYDSNSYSNVTRFEEFRMFGPTTEQINVMIDQSDALYSLFSGVKSSVWTKSAGAGQSYMQSVGNSLYFANGIDNKKWLQSLTAWSAAASWNGPTTPFMNTFLIDSNGNLQQLLGFKNTTISNVALTSNVLTLTVASVAGLSAGQIITLWGVGTATFLNGASVTITTAVGTTITAAFIHANYASAADTGYVSQVGGTPVSGGSLPTWNTTAPSSGNNFQGGITLDGTALWVNRGNPTKNWGIAPPTTVVVPTVGSSRPSWSPFTYYSLTSVVIDSNGNLQKVTQAGKSGSTVTWQTTLSAVTNDGTAKWTLIQLAASLTWAAHTVYAPGTFVVGNAGGTNCLFQVAPYSQPTTVGSVTAAIYNSPHSGPVGAVSQNFPAGAPVNSATGNSFLWNTGGDISAQPGKWETLNAAGEITGSTSPFSQTTDYMIAFTATLNVPIAGQYTFTVVHHDGFLFGVGGAGTIISGPNTDALGHTQTVVQGYTCTNGRNNVSGTNTDTIVVNFPAAGNYGIEIDYDFWFHSGNTLNVTCNGKPIVPGTPTSATTQPIWPSWSTSFAPQYPTIGDGVLIWNNLGPSADFAWAANINFTLPNTVIIDPTSNQEGSYRTGTTGASGSIPSFQTLLNQLTPDNGTLIWINQGAAAAGAPGTLSTFNGGWEYSIALVNTLDNTVSNGTPVSAAITVNAASGISLAPSAGLPAAANIDPQADFVAVFRTTDGEATPFLIPGVGNSTYTIPLSQYLLNGYTDTTPDTGLNNLISAAIGGENTPPAAGARNLTYHLNRIFYSVGNTVYWTSGPDSPVGNGTDGTSPLNFDGFPSLVQRIVPLVTGALVFTVSDVFLIQGSGTASSPIQKGVPYLQGIGILSYNALDVNGSLIALYSTDNQFLIFDPSSGVDYAGKPIGDQFRKNNGLPGTSWNAANVYVTWHVDGEDHAWYVSDGQFGWYRLMPTPAPETGLTWSPFANITGGCKAVQSIEISPGVHKLLIGPTSTGSLLKRDLSTFDDNGTKYAAYAIIGSAVLAQPGQIATVSFVTTESVRTGTPLVLGLLIDEAFPYFTGPFELLKDWVNDPPNLAPSMSIFGQRFYLAELQEQAAACRHMQMQVNWAAESAGNELLSLTVFGGYQQEN